MICWDKRTSAPQAMETRFRTLMALVSLALGAAAQARHTTPQVGLPSLHCVRLRGTCPRLLLGLAAEAAQHSTGQRNISAYTSACSVNRCKHNACLLSRRRLWEGP